MQEKLKQMIGHLPPDWVNMSPEEKMKVVIQKKDLLVDNDDNWGIHIGGYIDIDGNFKAQLSLEAWQAYACLSLKSPVHHGEFDINAFPEYLHAFIKKNAVENFETGDKNYNILEPQAGSGSFSEAAESMYFMLDLLAYGYELEAEELDDEYGDD